MCRSIKVLRRPEQAVTAEEVNAASLQFVRKISGYNRPSKLNQAAFDAAVAEIASVSERLLQKLASANTRTARAKGHLGANDAGPSN